MHTKKNKNWIIHNTSNHALNHSHELNHSQNTSNNHPSVTLTRYQTVKLLTRYQLTKYQTVKLVTTKSLCTTLELTTYACAQPKVSNRCITA